MRSLTTLFLAGVASASVPSLAGWQLTWSDDFNGAGKSLPSSAWRIDLGTGAPGGPSNWGTGEVTYYTQDPNNLCLTGDGNLQITPLKDSSGRWTSGRIESDRSDFMAQSGKKMRIQARIMMPSVTGTAAQGYWPAFWTLGGNTRTGVTWPSGGEFDIMENVNGIDKVWGTLHCDKAPGGACNEYNGLSAQRSCPNGACPGNWHTYSLEVDRSITPETLKWFVDDQQYNSLNANQVGADAWNRAVHGGHYIMLNVAMGGSFPSGVQGASTPNGGTRPGYPMLVDYVAVYNT